MTNRRLDVKRYAVQDRERTLTFTGALLGHASSRSDHHTSDDPCSHCRWAEISIYRTEARKYIVAGAGHSVREGETSRCWAHVADEATGVVASLYQFDGDNVRYLTRVARRALEGASEQDELIRKAFLIEEVA